MIQSRRVPSSDDGAGSCDLSVVVGSGGSVPLDQNSDDHALRLPPLALMRDESGIVHG